ncbi:MAG: hypothetical protein ACR2PX_01075 [Endozoicomonas sp.]|uniref:hypothetical protein n=1 Tax=Endozoicomonas sp. TaxID=1892382 RepID=UPI003D9ADF93
MAEEVKEPARVQSKQYILIDAAELEKLKRARQLILRRVEAEQESRPEARLKKLAIIRLDTLEWCKQESA